MGAATAIGFEGVYGFSDGGLSVDPDVAIVAQSTSGQCNIEGNISVPLGQRIYHLPGQEYYAETDIRPSQGERWFCSEAEARAAGPCGRLAAIQGLGGPAA